MVRTIARWRSWSSNYSPSAAHGGLRADPLVRADTAADRRPRNRAPGRSATFAVPPRLAGLSLYLDARQPSRQISRPSAPPGSRPQSARPSRRVMHAHRSTRLPEVAAPHGRWLPLRVKHKRLSAPPRAGTGGDGRSALPDRGGSDDYRESGARFRAYSGQSGRPEEWRWGSPVPG